MITPPARRRLVDYLRYRLDHYFTRGPAAQFTLLAAFTGAVVLVGAAGAFFFLFSPENKDISGIGHKIDEGFWDALWWSSMHFFDPSYVSQNYGATVPVIIVSVFLAFMGMVFFGALIGFISSGVERRFEDFAKGNRPVMETGHILILGWNDKLYSMLDLFEDYHKDVTIVILSELPIADMQERMRTERLAIRRVKPVLRTGSPTNLLELDRVAFRSAYSIIVLSDAAAAGTSGEPDIATIKTLMLLASQLPAGSPRPKMVAEIVSRQNVDVARIASQGSVSLICSSEVLGRMIVQASRQPGLSRVYGQLFGFRDNEIFIQPFPQCAGRRFDELRFEFPDAVLIGTSTQETIEGRVKFIQHINPASDYVVGAGEWLILLARDAKISHRATAGALRETNYTAPRARHPGREKILILGWNEKLYHILADYDTFLAPGSEVKIVAAHAQATAEALLRDKIKRPLRNLRCEYVEADYASQEAIGTLAADGYSNCMVLADESSDRADPDARAIVTLLLLQELRVTHPAQRFGHAVGEINATTNLELLQRHHGTNSVEIVSQHVVSMLLCQISQQLMLEGVYADLMDAGANEVYLRPIERYVRTPERCRFADIMLAAARAGEVAIGLKLASESDNRELEFGVKINPAKFAELKLTPADHVIVLSHGTSRVKETPAVSALAKNAARSAARELVVAGGEGDRIEFDPADTVFPTQHLAAFAGAENQSQSKSTGRFGFKRSLLSLAAVVTVGTMITLYTGFPEPSAVANPAPAAVAKPAAPGKEKADAAPAPKLVGIGAYVMSLYELNPTTNTFIADFWLWTTHLKSLDLKPLKSIEPENARTFTTSLDTTEEHGEMRYHAQKVRGLFNHGWDVTNFPFDHHELQVRLSEGQDESSALGYVADALNTGIDPAVKVEGWRIEKVTMTTDTRTFNSSFGVPGDTSGGSSYAQAVLSIFIARDAFGLFWKLHAAVYIAFLIGLISFFMDTSKDGIFNGRVSLLVGMIFAVVINTQRVTAALGQSPSFTLADKVHVVTLIALLSGIVAALISRKLQTTNRAELAARIDRRMAVGLFAVYLLVNVGMIASAARAG